MNIFLYGKWHGNAGPSNVNRSLIQHSDSSLKYFKHHGGKFMRFAEFLARSARASVVIFSESGDYFAFRLAKMLGKKTAILMHGDIIYESEINNLGLSKDFILQQKKKMAICDAIICVSEKFSERIKSRYPQYAGKITWINNGIVLAPRPERQKDKRLIALGGGNRNVKNNLNVCRAVELLNKKGHDYRVKLFGRIYKGNFNPEAFPFVEVMGHMDYNDFLAELDSVNLYVDVAYSESFGLSIADALNSRCSLLLSDNVGFLSIIKAEGTEVVKDCNNVQEIADKIEYLTNHGNSDRLAKSINPQTCSEDYAYKRLKMICGKMSKRDD